MAMDQVVEAQHHSDVISVSSATPAEQRDESSVVDALTDRVREYIRTRTSDEDQSRVSGEEPHYLQDMLNQVSGQVLDVEVPPAEEDAPSSTDDMEKCSACERSFRFRGPTLVCTGCSRTVHKNYCVRYMEISENLSAGMCIICCDKVDELILDIRRYYELHGMMWNQEAWIRKLTKSFARGIGLEYHSYRSINRLQKFFAGSSRKRLNNKTEV